MNRRPKQLAGLVPAAVMAVLLIPVRAFAYARSRSRK